jgi:hypothetical protein
MGPKSAGQLKVSNSGIANVLLQLAGDLFPLGFRGRHPLDKSSDVVRKVVVPVLGKHIGNEAPTILNLATRVHKFSLTGFDEGVAL